MAKTASPNNRGIEWVNVSALTGHSIVCGTSSWVTPSDEHCGDAVQHFAGVDANGRLLEFFLPPGASWVVVDVGVEGGIAPVRPAVWHALSQVDSTVYLALPDKYRNLIVCLTTADGHWQCVDVTKSTGISLDPGCCPVIWQSGADNQLVTHIVAVDQDHCLVEFCYSANGSWTTMMTGGTACPESLSAWQSETDNELTFHLTGITHDGQLIEHNRRQPGKWHEASVSKNASGMRHRQRPTVAWRSGQSEYIAATDVLGSIVLYQRSQNVDSQEWQCTNVSRETGRRVRSVSSGCTLHETRRAESNPIHCITAEANGHAYQFWWTQRNRWQVLDVTEITGIAGDRAVDFWQTGNDASTPEYIATIDNEQVVVCSGLQRLRQQIDDICNPDTHALKALGVARNMPLFSRSRHLKTTVDTLGSQQYPDIDAVRDAVFGSLDMHNSAASYLDYISGGALTLKRADAVNHHDDKPDLLIVATYKSDQIVEPSIPLWTLTKSQLEEAFAVVEWSTSMPLNVAMLVRQLLHHVANLKFETCRQFSSSGSLSTQHVAEPDACNQWPDIMSGGGQLNEFTFLHPGGVWKLLLGWVRPRFLTRNGRYSLKAVADSMEVIILPRAGREREEYFLLENRQRRPFDNLAESGIALWHVVLNPQEAAHPPEDKDETEWQHQPTWQQHIRLVSAPGRDWPPSATSPELEKAASDEASNGALSQHSNEALILRWADRSASGYLLSNLSPSADSMQFDLIVPR